MEDQMQALDQVRNTAIDLGMRFGPKALVAIVILVAGHMAGRWAGRATDRMLHRLDLDPPVRMLVVRAVRIVVFLLFGVLALQNLGVELLPLIAGLGIAGAGIALAVQGVLGNVAAGLTIIFTRPFRVGDYISIVKEEGEVLEVSIFNTVLGHPDLSKIVIPNRKVVGEILHNYGKIRQLDVEVGVSFDADLGAAFGAIQEVLRDNRRVLKDPEPFVCVNRLADSRIAIGVGAWVKVPDYGSASGEVYQSVLESFRRRGIAVPLPQREVRMLAPRG